MALGGSTWRRGAVGTTVQGLEDVEDLGGVGGVVLADADDLAARQHRRQQAHLVEPVLPLEQLDADVERVAREADDDGVVAGLAVLVEVSCEDAVRRLVTCSESDDAHPQSLARLRGCASSGQ